MGKVLWITTDGYQRNLQPGPPPMEMIDRFLGGKSVSIAVWINDDWATLFCLEAARGYSLNKMATKVAQRWPDDSKRMAARQLYGPVVILQGFGEPALV